VENIGKECGLERNEEDEKVSHVYMKNQVTVVALGCPNVLT
jgi:hypothetical protein